VYDFIEEKEVAREVMTTRQNQEFYSTDQKLAIGLQISRREGSILKGEG